MGNILEGPDKGLAQSASELKDCKVVQIDENRFILMPVILVDYKNTGPDFVDSNGTQRPVNLTDAEFDPIAVRLTQPNTDDDHLFNMNIGLKIKYRRRE